MEEFEAVADGVVGVEAQVAGEVVVPGDGGAVVGDALGEGVDAGDAEAWVGFVGGAEVVFDAYVELDGAGGEPAAAAGCEDGGFGDFGHAQGAGVEGAEGVLGAGGGGELDVVERGDHGGSGVVGVVGRMGSASRDTILMSRDFMSTQPLH